MRSLQFDFNNLFSFNVGNKHGITAQELARLMPSVRKAYQHFQTVIKNSANRIALSLEWTQLPYQDKKTVQKIQKLGSNIAHKYENIISLGIGGSYLGLKAAQDALGAPYYNEFPSLRGKRSRIYFDGNNLDPETLCALLKNLNPKKTFVIVISKSGETTETKVAFAVVENWLKKNVGKLYGRQIFAITDPQSGSLRKKIKYMQTEDRFSFQSLPLLQGVGGRYSELNMGLLHLATIGVSISEVLTGAQAMAKRCNTVSFSKNPALMYAALHTLLYQKKNKPIAIMMPFCESLKSVADWYVQLLAESTGKHYQRKIVRDSKGNEQWNDDTRMMRSVGRTPVPARGTNDLHSIQQNNVEGENDKVVTFIRVESFHNDLSVPPGNDILSGKKYSMIMKLAQEATEWALVRNSRPNCTIAMPAVTAHSFGQLLYFFEMATAYEGELLNINAFNQPGVESYKNYMYFKLRKPGIAASIANDIRQHPVTKKSAYIL